MKAVCILLQNHYDMDIRVRRKAEALVSAGYSVDVLALSSSSSGSRDYTLCGVNVYTVGLGKKRGSLARYVFEYVAFLIWALCKSTILMWKRRYAVIDVNNLPDILVFAAAIAKWSGAKVVFDMHEITPEFLMSKYGLPEGHWQVRLAKGIERASMRFADHVITINEPILELLTRRGLPPEKATVIMNSADESLFASPTESSGSAGAAGAPNRFVMMYHGTLTHIYGLDIAIEAFGMAHREMPDAEMWILGGGPEKSSLEALASKLGLGEKVRFVGTVPPQQVIEWLQRADAGVLATRQDVFLDLSFSNKLSEYIIMGKPVIASRLRTIRHYFSENALAYFKPNDPADLARAMVRVYNSRQLQEQLASEAKREYSPICWDVMKKRYLALMDRITGVQREEKVEDHSPEGVVLSR